MRVELKKAGPEDKTALRNLMQFYLYDFSEFLPMELDDDGLFKESLLDDYFVNPGKEAFFVKAEDRLAGFVLVSREILLEENRGGRCIKEFFIVRKHRRRGIGKAAATRVFALYPGRWEVRVEKTNAPAKRFWDEAIREATSGNYKRADRDDELWRGCMYSLNMKAAAF